MGRDDRDRGDAVVRESSRISVGALLSGGQRASADGARDASVSSIRAKFVGRSDHRMFRGGRPGNPLTRLARFRDGELHPLAPGDLSGSETVYVFVHGWTPGSATVADLVFAERGAPAPAWDHRIADMSGIPLVQAYTPLLSALAQRDPAAAVLWYSWVDQSATTAEVLRARESLQFTEINGRRLATALVLALGRGQSIGEQLGPWPNIQLIGHSHGCVVATHAALALPDSPAQLTLLDCPEDWFSRAGGAAGLLTDILPRLEPGREPDQVFVDSYASMFGAPYHPQPGLSDVVDVRLATPIRIGDDRGAVGYAHEYAVTWYTESVLEERPSSGYGWSVVAPRAQREGPDEQRRFDPKRLAAGYFVVAHNRPIENAARPERGPAEHTMVALDLGEVHLSPDAPDIAIAVSLSEAALVEFDYHIVNPGPATELEAAVNRILRFVAVPAATEVPDRGRYLRLPPNPDPEAPTLLQFRLVNPGPATVVRIASLTAVVAPGARNFDTVGTSTAIAALGAAAGAAATLSVVAVALMARRVAKELRRARHT